MKERFSLINFGKEVYQIWVNEKPNQLAAALAYFGMFSFAAVIFIAFWLASFFINEAAAEEQFYTRVEAVLGPETAAFIQESVSTIEASTSGGSLIVSVISFISLQTGSRAMEAMISLSACSMAQPGFCP